MVEFLGAGVCRSFEYACTGDYYVGGIGPVSGCEDFVGAYGGAYVSRPLRAKDVLGIFLKA